MKKKVWIINQYLTTPELNGESHRHSSLADEFVEKGYDVTLITSSFSHFQYRHNHIKGLYQINDYQSLRVLLLRGNKYKNTTGINRMLSWVIFTLLLFFIPTKKLPKPDIIIVSSLSLLPILNVVYHFKKKYKKVKFILEIRDIWPLSLIEIGGKSRNNVFVKFLSWLEKLGYSNADYIVSPLENTNKHVETILGHSNFKFKWISNGYQLNANSYYQDLDKKVKNRIPSGKFLIGYAGSLGLPNAMNYIISAINALDDKDICLCIVGGGNEKMNLVEQAANNENIIFMNKIPKDQVFSFLQEMDVLYLSFRALKLYEYGVSANKIFDYLYAEKPILFSASILNNVVEKANAGIVVEAEDVSGLIAGINKVKNMTVEDRKTMGLNGKDYLINNFTYEILADRYVKVFEELMD